MAAERIRAAAPADLPLLSAIEVACFPPAEAASEEALRERLRVYPDCFRLMEADGRVVAFVNGMATDEAQLRDEMYADASLHRPDGAWQMIFGVNTLPEYRGRGMASRLLESLIADARARGRRGLVLTCKQALLPFYARLGFVDEGLSESAHGGTVWHEMRLTFPADGE